MAVAKAEMPAWMRRTGAPAAVDAVIFLHYGMMWVATAACLAMVIGRRAFGLVEGSPVLSSASSLSLYSLTVGVLLYPVAIMLVGFRGMRSASKSKGNSKVPPRKSSSIMPSLEYWDFFNESDDSVQKYTSYFDRLSSSGIRSYTVNSVV
jgi:hypothetical protein